LPIPLTPLEEELIDTHMPVPKSEKDAWRKMVEEMTSEGKRVEIVRTLHRVLEAGEEERPDKKISESDYGQAFQGLIHKPDVLERIETLHTLASLPKEMRIKGSEARKVVASEDHIEKLHDLLQERISKIIPVKEFHPEGKAALKNVEYLGNLFKYNAGYASDHNHLEIFQMIQKAFLEKGVKGLKELKYHSKEFQEALPEEKTRAFLEKLDEEIGSASTGAGGPIDLYKIVEGKLADYEAHQKEVAAKDVMQEAREQTAQIEGKLKGALTPFGESAESKPIAEKIAALLAKKDYKNLEKEKEALRGRSLTGRADRLRGAVVGQLDKLTTLVKEAESINEAVEVGKDVTESIRGLKGKPYEKQLELLEKIKQEHGREKLEKHGNALGVLGKPVYKDMSYFITQVLEPPQAGGEGEGVTTRITHNLQQLFTLGKFENNCQSPGVQQSQSLLGFVAHPSELTFGHFSNEGEYIGFTFAHVLQRKDGHSLIFERSYTNHGHLKETMRKTNEELGRRIEKLAKEKGVALKVYFHDRMPSKEHTVLRSPYVHKWYDVAHGQVHGGETV